MAKFFVGQQVRVRWVAQAENAHIVGKESRICDVLNTPLGVMYGLDDYPITREIGESGVLSTSAFRAEQLEPVVGQPLQPCARTFAAMMDNLRNPKIVRARNA